MAFLFRGEVAGSKSIFNRALIVQSFSERVQVHGLTQCEDVLHLQKALRSFKNGEKDFDCGDGGTTFRFLAIRVSRDPGEYIIRGSSQLFARPIKPLLSFLDQVGVGYKLEPQMLRIHSSGWKMPSKIFCEGTESSQFASAIVLNCWELPQEVQLVLPPSMPSRGYLQMTLHLVEFYGMEWKLRPAHATDGESLYIPAEQKTKSAVLRVEQDMSSLFTLAACAVMDGELEIARFPITSWQPDSLFLEFFKKMKIEYSIENGVFFIRKQQKYRGLDVDILHSPDLFPVLAVLVSRAEGVSAISGLDNLQFKESDRLKNTIELLQRLGRKVELTSKGVQIQGSSMAFSAEGEFDPDGDHRMAMAAQVANFGGAKLKILDKQVVNKSFPEFWEIVDEDA